MTARWPWYRHQPGLGKAIAQRLAREGATVALTARTMEPDPKYQGSLRQTLAEIEAAGGSAIAIHADLSNAEDRERLFGEVVERVGAPDILVNNAAVRSCGRSTSSRTGGCG